MKWRLVDSDLMAPALTAACDEAILTARHEGLVPNTLHLYRRDSPTVSLGHFEKVKECVDLAAVQRHGVQLVRRMSGGSTIYTDSGQIVYALFIDRADAPGSPVMSFAKVCQGIVLALRRFGLEGEFRPANDVLVRGRKISGSAQLRRWEVLAQQGTVLVKTDYGIMFEVLRCPKRRRNEMTSLSEELGYVPEMDAVKSALAGGFSAAFGVELVPGPLTEEEVRLAYKLAREKYGSPEHTCLR